MKHEKLFSILVAASLAFVTALGAAGCILSAFPLIQENPDSLIAICGLSSLVCAGLFSVRHGGKLLLCLLALGAGYLYQEGTALSQFQNLCYQLSVIYDRAYGRGILQISDAAREAVFCDYPLGILATLIAVSVTWCMLCRKSTWLPVLTTVLPLCSCIVVTDTVPDELWLLMVMAGLILLVLSASVRRENVLQSLRLTAHTALPVVLALAALFLSFPREGYVNRSAVLRENILIAAQNIPRLLNTGMTQLTASLRKESANQVDLSAVGERIPFTYPVMEVTAESSGTLYLREQDYDQYTGLGWVATEGRRERFSGIPGDTEAIQVQTRIRRNTLYLPYHPADAVLTNGFCANQDDLQTYTTHRQTLPPDWRVRAYGDTPIPYSLESCLVLPEQTRQSAENYLQDYSLFQGHASPMEKADIIAALVMDRAKYDLNTGRMPEGHQDFALWFLRGSDTGYCVHFATAATVLLRAAGVPARYVTGYMLEAQAGKPVTVTEENAHAWAEFYEPNLGLWLPLEATPAAEAPMPPAVPDPIVPATPEATEPEPATTEASTEATEPAQTIPSEIPASPTEPVLAPDKKPSVSPFWLMLPLASLILAVQKSVRLSLRRKRQHTGTPNRQALQRWREAERLSRLLGEVPPEALTALAQKAKFSQHELTAEELLQFDSFNRGCVKRLQEKPGYLQPIYRLIYAVY